MSDQTATVEWRDIPGYEGLYQVSNDGQVKRLGGTAKCKQDRLLKLAYNKGYAQVALCRDGKAVTKQVHTLVTLVFLGDPGDLWCNHKNGIKSDNRLENLEYVTPGENTKHAYDTGLHPKVYGEKHWTRKLTDEQANIIQLASSLVLEEVGGRKGLAKYFGVSLTTIQAIITGKGGYGDE